MTDQSSAPEPSAEYVIADMPAFTVDKYGSLGGAISAERNWLFDRLKAAERHIETLQRHGSSGEPGAALPDPATGVSDKRQEYRSDELALFALSVLTNLADATAATHPGTYKQAQAYADAWQGRQK